MENSKIEWTHHTFNPWMGCTKVSAGCKNCYAETLMDERYGKVKWGPTGKRIRTSKDNWRKPIQWNKWAKEKGVRYRVFCASLADVFEDKPDQPEMDEWRADLMRVISATPNLDWLLLTKRPENVIPKMNAAIKLMRSDDNADNLMTALEWIGWVKGGKDYLSNVWIGTSVEDQAAAEKRIPELLKIPSAVRFLSMEPLLSRVDLSLIPTNVDGFDVTTDTLRGTMTVNGQAYLPVAKIDWVIVGGESGPNARPMHPGWLRSIRDQCVISDVPLFFKQWGEWASVSEVEGAGEHYHFPDGATVRRVGKKNAGRLLGGQEWSQFPV